MRTLSQQVIQPMASFDENAKLHYSHKKNISRMKYCAKSEVPNSQASDYTAGGKQWVSQRSFICIHSHSPSLELTPELCLLSD